MSDLPQPLSVSARKIEGREGVWYLEITVSSPCGFELIFSLGGDETSEAGWKSVIKGEFPGKTCLLELGRAGQFYVDLALPEVRGSENNECIIPMSLLAPELSKLFPSAEASHLDTCCANCPRTESLARCHMCGWLFCDRCMICLCSRTLCRACFEPMTFADIKKM